MIVYTVQHTVNHKVGVKHDLQHMHNLTLTSFVSSDLDIV